MPATIPRSVRAARREEAEARGSAYAALTIQERVARLDARLGKNKGAKKERAKLAAA
jgi:hypothetical protein